MRHLDDLPAMVLLLGGDGRLLHANRACAAFLGLPAGATDGGTDGDGAGWPSVLDDASRARLLAELALRRDFVLQLGLARCAGGSASCVELAAHALDRDGGGNGEGGGDGRRREEGIGDRDRDAMPRPAPASHACVLRDLTAHLESQRAALSRTQQFRLLADSLPVLVAYYEVDGLRCRFANKRYARAFGYDERSILRRTMGEIVGADDFARIEPHVRRLLRERRPVSYERELRGADGAACLMEVNLVPHLDGAGEPVAIFALLSDITRFREAERAVRESEERLAKFMQASAEGIVFFEEGLVTDANPAACALFGLGLDELRGRSPFELVPVDQIAVVADVMKRGAETTYETVALHRDGRRIPVECLTRTLLHDGVRVRMAIVRDLTDRLAAQARIQHMAHHDALTGLPNRSAFIERLEHLAASTRPGDDAFALLFIDLDHFKRVNDSLGHLAGDRVLQAVSARLTEGLRASDGVARFGGDEFVVLLHGASRRDDVEAATLKLMGAIEVAVEAEGGPIAVSPSIGIALHPRDGTTPAELIRRAEAAMHEAKRRGRASYRFFEPGLADAAYASLVLEGELAWAIARDEFVLHFQPQVCAASGTPVGAEALIRWRHPERGLLGPDQFIPLAEQRRLMLPIGRWVLRMAARSARRWQRGALAGVSVGVNLTSIQFDALDFVDFVADVLREEGLPGHLLELELTERMVTADLPATSATLARLKALGVRISLDDFGTGYTSLGQLKALPVDKMKIDRCFVADLPHDRKSAAITRAIVQIARGLDIRVIAEGVENEAQHRALLEYGCDELQGHAVSAPLGVEELEEWAAGRGVGTGSSEVGGGGAAAAA